MRLMTNDELFAVSGGYTSLIDSIVEANRDVVSWADEYGFGDFSLNSFGLLEATSSTPVASTADAVKFITDLKKSVSADAKLECKIHYDNKDGKNNVSVDCTITIGGGLNSNNSKPK